MNILLATSNPHKIEEVQQIFASESTAPCLGLGHAPAIRIVSLAQMNSDHLPEPVEDAPTFEGNAIKKAQHYAAAIQCYCLADDSGLEVDALNGQPGVKSARYSGQSGPRSVVDPANNRLLLDNLMAVPAERRTARFVCAMALCDPQGQCLTVQRGTVEGRILLPSETADPAQPHRGRGENGFGYDPLFWIPSRNRTTAELSPAEKNALSHRGHASRLMYQAIVRLGLPAESA